MAKVTYKQIPALIKEKKAFECSSVSAFHRGNSYIVKSYKTDIYKVNIVYGDVVFNITNYSQTTRKLQNIIIELLCEIPAFKIKLFNHLREGARL